MAETAMQTYLQGIVIGMPPRLLQRDVAVGRILARQRIDGWTGRECGRREHAENLMTVWSDFRNWRVRIVGLYQVNALGADIPNRQNVPAPQLTLDIEVVLHHVRRGLEVIIHALHFGNGGRRNESSGREGSRIGGLDLNVDGIGRIEPVVAGVEASEDHVVKDSKARANGGLMIRKRIVS